MPGGLYERDGEGRIFNTAIAVSPQGEIAARYRKAFPWQPYEATEPGHEFAWTNQVYVVNLDAADPAGVGHSAIVDPEGTVRRQAAGGEEILIDVLDLDAVTRVRRYGSSGLNRPWAQLERYGHAIELPAYGGGFRPRPSGRE